MMMSDDVFCVKPITMAVIGAPETCNSVIDRTGRGSERASDFA